MIQSAIALWRARPARLVHLTAACALTVAAVGVMVWAADRGDVVAVLLIAVALVSIGVPAARHARRCPTSARTTVAAAVDGKHEDGETVSVTGTANGWTYETTEQGDDWATFLLITSETAVRVSLYPRPYRQFADRLGPAVGPDGDSPPPEVTVIGRVDCREPVPALIADTVTRLSVEDGPSLAEVRAESEALNARPDVQEALREALDAPTPTRADLADPADVEALIAQLEGGAR